MKIFSKMITDSISPEGIRLSSLEVSFPRFLLAEFNTHRIFSRNFRSSRAVPVSKLIEEVRKTPYEPIVWRKNIPGMQGGDLMSPEEIIVARKAWLDAANAAADQAEKLAKVGLHKQWANRCLEPFLYVHGIVTSTEWDNFFLLRQHKDAQPEFYELANQMKLTLDNSVPKQLNYGDWHLPYILPEEMEELNEWKTRNTAAADNFIALKYDDLIKISCARAARVSYKMHDGKATERTKDIQLHDKLVGSEPRHSSPAEHQAIPLLEDDWSTDTKNFRGWVPYRSILENR